MSRSGGQSSHHSGTSSGYSTAGKKARWTGEDTLVGGKVILQWMWTKQTNKLGRARFEEQVHAIWNMDSLVAQTVKSLLAIQETLVQLLGQKEPLEKEMATPSSTLAWRIPWMKEPGRPWSMGSQKVGHWVTSLSSFLFFHAAFMVIGSEFISPPLLIYNKNNWMEILS